MVPLSPPAAAGITVTLRRSFRQTFILKHSSAYGFGSMHMRRPRGICGSTHKANMPMLAPISTTVSSICSPKPACEYCPHFHTWERTFVAHMRQGGTGDNLPRPIIGGHRAVRRFLSKGGSVVKIISDSSSSDYGHEPLDHADRMPRRDSAVAVDSFSAVVEAEGTQRATSPISLPRVEGNSCHLRSGSPPILARIHGRGGVCTYSVPKENCRVVFRLDFAT
jgi:hypothetical protein